MSFDDEMIDVYNLLLKEYKSSDAIYESGSYQCKVYHELYSDGYYWHYNIPPVLDINSWNLKKLINEHGRIKKPQVFAEIYLTSKDNLVLDWYPYHHLSDIKYPKDSDYLRWTDARHGQTPYNRLLMIRSFSHLVYKGKKSNYNKIDCCLIRATKDLIDTVLSHINHFVDVVRITDLYITRQKDWRKIKEIKILNVKETEKKEHQKLAFEEIQILCDEFSITPEQVIQVYKNNDFKWAPTARELSRPNIRHQLSTKRLKKLIQNIYYHTDVYSKLLKKPPQGCEPKHENVVQFPKKK